MSRKNFGEKYWIDGGDYAPLFQNFRVVSAKAVDTLDDKHVVGFEFAQNFFVLRTIKILAALLIDEDLVDAETVKSEDLTIFVLVF